MLMRVAMSKSTSYSPPKSSSTLTCSGPVHHTGLDAGSEVEDVDKDISAEEICWMVFGVASEGLWWELSEGSCYFETAFIFIAAVVVSHLCTSSMLASIAGLALQRFGRVPYGCHVR